LSQPPSLHLALVGNPNSGKTTLFNALTGSRQHVGNWPGKTVERKRGMLRLNGALLTVEDLPGTYSLSAYSEEECIARDALLDAPPDLLLIVLDACHLERHLYLALQVLEIGRPAIVVLNMLDLAEKQGLRLDPAALSHSLNGVPVVALSARSGAGLAELKAEIAARTHDILSSEASTRSRVAVNYGELLEAELRSLARQVSTADGMPGGFDARWLALNLFEGEPGIGARISGASGGAGLLLAASEAHERVERQLGCDVRLEIANQRYGFAGGVARAARLPQGAPAADPGTGDRLDRILTHPVFGALSFLLVMYLVFSLVVEVSAPYLDWISNFFNGPLTRWAAFATARMGAPAWVRGLLVEGVIDGVGGVLVFLPGLVVLFGFLAFLEDSGYLARAAFVMNRALSWMGLNGKSFVPLVLGFGCAVPAVYATRTLENHRDRLLTALLIPFMSCSARLPVYVVFSLALFGRHANLVIWGLYALGVAFAALAGWVLSRTMLRSDGPASFILEMPSYRWPNLRDISRMVRRRTAAFMRNAGTVILAASLFIWLLLNLPVGAGGLEETYFGGVSRVIAPAFEPAGFGTWQASGALMTGLVAKEVVVSTMSQVFIGGGQQPQVPEQIDIKADLIASGNQFLDATLQAARRLLGTLSLGLLDRHPAGGADSTQLQLGQVLQREFSRPAALAFLAYVLLYIPCIATLSALRAEFGLRWALFSAAYQSLVAWAVAVGVFQLARLLIQA